MQKTCFIIIFLILTSGNLKAQNDDSVRLIRTETEKGFEITAENDNYFPVTMEIDFDLENMKSTKGNSITMVIQGKQTKFVTNIEQVDENKSGGLKYSLKYYQGSISARHDNRIAYRLPFKKGTTLRLDQGYNGDFSHKGSSRYALDFNMDEGTEIYSARKGLVIDIEESFSEGGSERSYLDKSNFISILHEDGTIAQYSHLKKNGVRVRLGQSVKAGEVIGYSGATGYVTGPHLHFVVLKAKKGGGFESIPTKFATKDGIQQLKEGEKYTAY